MSPPHTGGPEVLQLCLELARADETGDPHAFEEREQRYVLRWGDGAWSGATFAWDEAFREDLQAMQREEQHASRLDRLGQTLRSWLEDSSWADRERDIQEALDAGRPVCLTLVFAAAELTLLPWELIKLRPSGLRLGATPGLWLRYDWADLRGRSETAVRPRVLLAWSGAAGDVTPDVHRMVVQATWKDAWKADRDELPECSLAQLRRTLRQRRKVTVLHLVCHGVELAGGAGASGLALRRPDGQGLDIVEPTRLAELLRAEAPQLQVLLLFACRSAQAGDPRRTLSSVALACFQAGVPAVVASRYPVTLLGAVDIARASHGALVAGEPLEPALGEARSRLIDDPDRRGDWVGCTLLRAAEAPPFVLDIAPPPPSPARRLRRVTVENWAFGLALAGPLWAVLGLGSAAELRVQGHVERLFPVPVENSVVIDIGEAWREPALNREQLTLFFRELAALPLAQRPLAVGLDLSFEVDLSQEGDPPHRFLCTEQAPLALSRPPAQGSASVDARLADAIYDLSQLTPPIPVVAVAPKDGSDGPRSSTPRHLRCATWLAIANVVHDDTWQQVRGGVVSRWASKRPVAVAAVGTELGYVEVERTVNRFSLPLTMLAAVHGSLPTVGEGGVKLGAGTIPVIGGSEGDGVATHFLLPYVAEREPLRLGGFLAALEGGHADLGLISGRYVFLGVASKPASGAAVDHKVTRWGERPGVVVHADHVEAIEQGRMRWLAARPVDVGLTVLVAAGGLALRQPELVTVLVLVGQALATWQLGAGGSHIPVLLTGLACSAALRLRPAWSRWTPRSWR